MGFRNRRNSMKGQKSRHGFFALCSFLAHRKMLFGGGGLFFLLLIGIILVPFADRTPQGALNEEAQLLPAKLWEPSSGFWDGTGKVNGALIDPATGEPAADLLTDEPTYPAFAITGEKKVYSVLTNEITDEVKAYGRGGALAVSLTELGQSGGLQSAPFLFDASEGYSFGLSFESALSSAKGNAPAWALFLKADFAKDQKFSAEIPLTFFAKDYAATTVSSSAVKTALNSSDAFVNQGGAPFEACLEIRLQSVSNAPLPTLYVHSFSLHNSLGETPIPVSGIPFSDGIGMFALKEPWFASGSAQLSLGGATLLLADFSFDYYARAFGLSDSGFRKKQFSEAEINDFIARGWLAYRWGNATGNWADSFQILDSFHCPIRSVEKEITDSRGQKSLQGLESPYRYQYYRGWIATCGPQKYFFGTNEKGQDLALLAFGSLGSSLSSDLVLALMAFLGVYFVGLFASYFGGMRSSRLHTILWSSGLGWFFLLALLFFTEWNGYGLLVLVFALLFWLLGNGLFSHWLHSKEMGMKGQRGLSPSKVLAGILPGRFPFLASTMLYFFPGALLGEILVAYLFPEPLVLPEPSLIVLLSGRGSLFAGQPLSLTLALIFAFLLPLSLILFESGLLKEVLSKKPFLD